MNDSDKWLVVMICVFVIVAFTAISVETYTNNMVKVACYNAGGGDKCK